MEMSPCIANSESMTLTGPGCIHWLYGLATLVSTFNRSGSHSSLASQNKGRDSLRGRDSAVFIGSKENNTDQHACIHLAHVETAKGPAVASVGSAATSRPHTPTKNNTQLGICLDIASFVFFSGYSKCPKQKHTPLTACDCRQGTVALNNATGPFSQFCWPSRVQKGRTGEDCLGLEEGKRTYLSTFRGP